MHSKMVLSSCVQGYHLHSVNLLQKFPLNSSNCDSVIDTLNNRGRYDAVAFILTVFTLVALIASV